MPGRTTLLRRRSAAVTVLSLLRRNSTLKGGLAPAVRLSTSTLTGTTAPMAPAAGASTVAAVDGVGRAVATPQVGYVSVHGNGAADRGRCRGIDHGRVEIGLSRWLGRQHDRTGVELAIVVLVPFRDDAVWINNDRNPVG